MIQIHNRCRCPRKFRGCSAVRIFVQGVGMVRELANIFLSLRFGKFPKLDFCVMGLTKVGYLGPFEIFLHTN